MANTTSITNMPNKIDISRRSFFKGSMAFAADLALECLDGADVFSAVPAYADEAAETKIMIVRPTQIGIVAYDLRNPKNPSPVPDCKIIITSRYNKKTVEGTTNSEGKIILDIKDLSENPDDDTPSFNGSITVEKEGYREVVVPLTRIIGHTAFIAPTRPLDGKPYFKTLTFNEWDVQYTKPSFVRDATNTKQQVIAGELVMPYKTVDPYVKLMFNEDGLEKKIGDFDVLGTQGYIAKLEIKGEFLNSSKDVCIKENIKPKVIFSTSSSTIKYETNINIDVKPAPISQHTKSDKIIVPSAFGDSQNIFELPNNFIKPFAGSKFTVWKPSFPVLLEASPLGYFMIGYGYTSVIPKSDKGEFLDLDSWKKAPTQSISEQIKKQSESQKKAIDSYNKQRACPNDPTKTKKVSYSATAKFKVIINVQAFAMLKYDWKDDIWTGSLSGVLSCGISATWTIQASILIVPVFLQVSPSFTMQASLYLGAQTKDINKLDFQAQNKSLGFGTNIAIALTVGVGINGFASVSCTGAGYISYFVNFAPNDGKPIPHIIAGCGGKVTVTLQFTFFKYTFKICGGDWPQLFDSNKDSKTKSASDVENVQEALSNKLKETLNLKASDSSFAASSDGMPSFDELKENAVAVTNAEMLNSKEFNLASNVLDGSLPVTIEYNIDTFNINDDDLSDEDDTSDEQDSSGSIVIVPESETIDFSDTSYVPTYDYVGTMKDILLDGTGARVDGISDSNLGGIKPSTDNLLFENITSNPRLRILQTRYGKTVMFRIATVDVGGGNARSRIVYHLLRSNKWSEPYVIDFEPQIPGLSRSDMYDFDFDVVQADGYDGSNYIFLNVISGTRLNGDKTSFVDGIQVRYACLVSLYDSNFSTNPLRINPNMTCNLVSISEGGTLVCPAINAYSDELSVVGTKDFCIIASVVKKSVSSDGMGTGSIRRTFFARWEYDTDRDINVFKVNYTHGQRVYGDQTKIFPVQLNDEGYEPGVGTAAKVRCAACVSAGSNRIEIYRYQGVYSDILPWKKYFQYFIGERIAFSGSEYSVDKIYSFGSLQGFLLASCKVQDTSGQDSSGIFKVTFDPKNEGNINFTQISDNSGSVSDIVSDSNGHYLFYAENIDGKTGQEYTPDENGQVNEPSGDIESKKYYIKAMANVKNIFTRPFVFAELDHPADSLAAAYINDSYVSFMVDDITNIDKSISNIYDVRIPIVKCLTPTALTSVEPFCFSGEPSTFAVQFRNDGNLVATGATFNFVDAETDQTIDKKKITFEDVKDSVQSDGSSESTYNLESLSTESDLENNPILQDDGANVVLPGETRIYNLDFTIPSDWADEKKVRVEITDIEVITPSGIENNSLGAAEENFDSYHISNDENPAETIQIANSTSIDDLNVESGEVSEINADENENSGNSGDPENSNDSGNSGNGKGTPKTDDAAAGNIALAALGAAAAGFGAYSARRVAIENEELGE